jgi:hypothetical protein
VVEALFFDACAGDAVFCATVGFLCAGVFGWSASWEAAAMVENVNRRIGRIRSLMNMMLLAV